MPRHANTCTRCGHDFLNCGSARQCDANLAAREAQALGPCAMFALCDRDAVTTVTHPWGEVPACQRCADKYARLGGQ
jgi:hypothetical protein